MANRLRLGLDEWKANLEREPVALATAAEPPVTSAADAAADELRAAYPRGETGNLRGQVRVDRDASENPAVAAAVVVSGAPHAHLYEDGTRYARAHPTFYPITNRHARDMESKVSAIVARENYTVTGAID